MVQAARGIRVQAVRHFIHDPDGLPWGIGTATNIYKSHNHEATVSATDQPLVRADG